MLACHLVAVALFLAGLFTTGGLLPGLARADGATGARQREIRRLVRLTGIVTTPALLLVWTFGIAMTVSAGWSASGWLQAKVALVLMLSGWHVRHAWVLHRLAAGRTAPRPRTAALALAALAVVAIIALVVGKPF